MMNRALAIVLFVALVSPGASYAEKCREFRDPRPACTNWLNYFVPAATGVVYAPNDGGTSIGGGIEIALLSWSRNRSTFGPSQGVLLFHAALLNGEGDAGFGSLVEFGANLSLERNASRSWLIPFYGVTLGRTSGAGLPTAWFAQPVLGAHLLWTRNVAVDLRGGYHIPFSSVDQLHGLRAQLSVRFTFW